MFLQYIGRNRAPEFSPELDWLQGGAVTLRELRERAILLWFYRPSSMHALHMLPILKRWQIAYAPHGLEIIGVIAPEFGFEEERSVMLKSVRHLDIPFRVALDAKHRLGRQYKVHAIPRSIVIDGRGGIVHDHIGERGYAETEMAIQEALLRLGVRDLPAPGPEELIGGGLCFKTTEEIHLGYHRGGPRNAKEKRAHQEEAFNDPGELVEGQVQLHGHWKLEAEFAEHTRSLASATEYLVLEYGAYCVYALLGAETPAEVEIELGGKPLPEEMMGEDVKEVGGKAILTVRDTRLYHIVDADKHHKAKLKLKMKDAELKAYGFSFGSCRSE